MLFWTPLSVLDSKFRLDSMLKIDHGSLYVADPVKFQKLLKSHYFSVDFNIC